MFFDMRTTGQSGMLRSKSTLNMASLPDNVVKQGHLQLKTKLGVWKKNWMVLKTGSDPEDCRLEKFKTEAQAAKQKPSRIKYIPLVGVKDVSRLPKDVKKHGLAIIYRDCTCRQLSANSDYEADEWTLQIKTVVAAQQLSPAARIAAQQLSPAARIDHGESFTSNYITGAADVCPNSPEHHYLDMWGEPPSPPVLNNNTLVLEAQSSTDFLVNVISSPLLNLPVLGRLRVTDDALELQDASRRRTALWSHRTIRQFGIRNNNFFIEAGRFCETGEGIYEFASPQASQLHRLVNQAVMKMAQTLKVESERVKRPRALKPLRTSAAGYPEPCGVESPEDTYHPIHKRIDPEHDYMPLGATAELLRH